MRFLLMCTLGAALLSGAHAADVDQDVEGEAVAYFEKLGARIEKDPTDPKHPVTALFLKKLDEGQLASVLTRLRCLSKLGTFDLFDVPTADGDLETLQHLNTLHTVAIAKGLIRGPGIRYLVGLKKLKQLELSWCPVEDAGLEHIKKMKSLDALSLAYSKVTDKGVAQLKDMKQLTSLGLAGTAIGDRGLEHIAGLTDLKVLDLSQTPVTDDGLRYLQTMKNLEILGLNLTKNLSDEGLKHLYPLKNLRTLAITRKISKFTKKGVEDLRKALPNTKIRWL